MFTESYVLYLLKNIHNFQCISFSQQINLLRLRFTLTMALWKWGNCALSSIKLTWNKPRAALLLMSEDSDSKPYRFLVLEDEEGASGCRVSTSCSSMPRGASACSSMAQLHRMGGYSQGGPNLGLPLEGSYSSGQYPASSPHNHRKNGRSRSLTEEDMEMKSSGSSGSGTESHGNESHGNESHGNESHGHESMGSSNGTSKDSALLESSESNKRSVVVAGMIILWQVSVKEEESGELLFL